MLRRVYIDNFRCFVHFELQLDRPCLLLGGNGSGKSSLMDALQRVRQFVVVGRWAEDCFPLREHTRWVANPRQTIELDFEPEGAAYKYRLVTEPVGAQKRIRVAEETVYFGAHTIFSFVDGELKLYNDRFEHKVTINFDWHRSALAIVTPRPDNRILTKLLKALPRVAFFRPNPFSMRSSAEAEDQYPRPDLSNFASWYRHLRQVAPDRDEQYRLALERALDGFRFLRFNPSGPETRLLEAEFSQPGGAAMRSLLEELSEGQRCLLGLYAILFFLLGEAGTVFLDEPDNFVALREIQPWLQAAGEILDSAGSQLVIISHHPEILNQWAPNFGVVFFRGPNGPARTRRFGNDYEGALTPSEIIAGGWEHE